MSFESPISVLQNLAGEEVAVVSGSALGSTQPGVAVLAKDESGNAQFLNMNASGELKVQATVDVDLDYATDSVTVYGSQGASLVQDAADDYLLVRDNDAKGAIEAAATAITGSVAAMDSNLGGKLDTLDGSVDAAASAITGSVETMNSNLGGKLDTLDGSVDAAASAITGSVETMNSNLGGKLDTLDGSVDAAAAAITGSVETMNSNLGGKLDTLDGSVDAAAAAITGSVEVMNSNLGGKLDTLDGSVIAAALAITSSIASFEASFNSRDLATEITLDGFKTANHEDLMSLTSSVALVETAVDNASAAISSSIAALGADFNSRLDQFQFDSNALIVTGNLNVDVALTQADEVTVYQGTNPWIVNDSTVSGAIDAFRTDFNEFVPGLSGAIAEGNASLAVIEAIDFASEVTLDGFKTANHLDLQAVSGAIEAFRTDFNNFTPGLSGVLVENNASLSGAIDSLGADLSSKLAQFQFDSNALIVTGNLNVDVALTQDDQVTVFQGTDPWVVSATDLDIRDLTYVSDSVSIYGDEGMAFAQISGSGEMITVPLGSEGNSLLQAASGSIWSDANGNGALLVGLLGSNSKNVLASSANDILYVSGAGEFAISNMVDVSALATESTLSNVSGAIDGLGFTVDAVKAAVQAIDAAQLGTVTVQATALDIRPLTNADVVTVESSDLDIRDLDEATDGVGIFGMDSNNVSHQIRVDGAGAIVNRKKATSASVYTKVASTSADAITANDDRMGATFFMDGNATCYIKLGSNASSTDYSVRLVNNGYYELPEGYTGAISVVFSVNDGSINLRVTELSYA